MAIGVVVLSPPSPQPTAKTAKTRAAISPAMRFIATSLCSITSTLQQLSGRQGALGAPVAPGQRARAFVKPAILRHHLRRPRKTKSKAGAREKHDIGHEIVIGGKQCAVEQGVMEEADRGGKQRHIDENPPERFPCSRQALPREERRAAADDDGEHEEDAETVVGEQIHARAPPAPWAPPSR